MRRATADEFIGKKFGRLFVKELSERRDNGKKIFVCICDCGAVVEVRLCAINNGNTKSCGCLKLESSTKPKRLTHGLSKTRTYNIWAGMKKRCMKTSSISYQRYGGRGIKVCDRWEKFENFYADMGEAPDGFSLERINNDGDYCQENCKWIPKDLQGLNKSTNVLLTARGKTQPITEWAKEIGIGATTLFYRFRKGWGVEDIFRPIDERKRRYPNARP